MINLAYSLAAYSSRYKLNLEEKLISLNLDQILLNKLLSINFPENDIYPSFLFILGFFFRGWNIALKIRMKREK